MHAAARSTNGKRLILVAAVAATWKSLCLVMSRPSSSHSAASVSSVYAERLAILPTAKNLQSPQVKKKFKTAVAKFKNARAGTVTAQSYNNSIKHNWKGRRLVRQWAEGQDPVTGKSRIVEARELANTPELEDLHLRVEHMGCRFPRDRFNDLSKRPQAKINGIEYHVPMAFLMLRTGIRPPPVHDTLYCQECEHLCQLPGCVVHTAWSAAAINQARKAHSQFPWMICTCADGQDPSPTVPCHDVTPLLSENKFYECLVFQSWQVTTFGPLELKEKFIFKIRKFGARYPALYPPTQPVPLWLVNMTLATMAEGLRTRGLSLGPYITLN